MESIFFTKIILPDNNNIDTKTAILLEDAIALKWPDPY